MQRSRAPPPSLHPQRHQRQTGAGPLAAASRGGVLAQRSDYQQWRQESGHDLQALLETDFEELVLPTPSLRGPQRNCAQPEWNQHQQQCGHIALSAPSGATGSVSSSSFSSSFLARGTGGPGGSAGSNNSSSIASGKATQVNWREVSMVKGELLIKVVFQIALHCPQALQEQGWLWVLRLLQWTRSRGALPASLALVAEDHDTFNADIAPSRWSRTEASALYAQRSDLEKVAGADPRAGARGTSADKGTLLPSVYARECYLRAFGLAFESIYYRPLCGRCSNSRLSCTQGAQWQRWQQWQCVVRPAGENSSSSGTPRREPCHRC